MRISAIATPSLDLWALLSTLIGIALLSTLAHAQAREPRSDAARAAVVTRLLARGERQAEAGRTRSATAAYRRAATLAPADPRPAIALASLLLPDGPRASRAVEPPPAVRAAAAEVLALLETALPPDDPTDEASRSLSRAVQGMRPWAVALAGDHRRAIDLASLAAGRLDDVAAASLTRLAALSVGRHDLEAADRALIAARRADPADVTILTDLAAIRLARGRAADAIRLLLEAERRRPEDLGIERDLAGALLADGRVNDAMTRFAAIAAERNADGRAHLDLARAALEAGSFERAADAARTAQRLLADDPEPSLVLAAACLVAQDQDGARAAFVEANRRAPGDVRAIRGLRALSDPLAGDDN